MNKCNLEAKYYDRPKLRSELSFEYGFPKYSGHNDDCLQKTWEIKKKVLEIYQQYSGYGMDMDMIDRINSFLFQVKYLHRQCEIEAGESDLLLTRKAHRQLRRRIRSVREDLLRKYQLQRWEQVFAHQNGMQFPFLGHVKDFEDLRSDLVPFRHVHITVIEMVESCKNIAKRVKKHSK